MELNQSGYSISELCKCARISRSSYYKWLNRKETQRDKENKEISKFHGLCKKLPIYARRYLQNREMAVKYSTLVAYTYDLQTFFEFLKENNPELESMETREIPAEAIAMLDADDIMEFQRYLRFHELDNKISKNDNKAIARKMTPVREKVSFRPMSQKILKCRVSKLQESSSGSVRTRPIMRWTNC